CQSYDPRSLTNKRKENFMNPQISSAEQELRSLFSKPWARREFLKLSAAGVLGCSMSGWFERLAAQTVQNPQRRRSCILLWMPGGPSQMDTFDLKPGNANGGPFQAIDTAAPG